MTDVRDVTDRLADLDGPPIRIDMDHVITTAVRKARRRRAAVTATTVLATAAVLAGALVLGNVAAAPTEVGTQPSDVLSTSVAMPEPSNTTEAQLTQVDNLLRAWLPRAMPGWQPGESSHGRGEAMDWSVVYLAVENKSAGMSGGLLVRMFGPSSANVMRRQYPVACPAAPRGDEPECLPQPDGSTVQVQRYPSMGTRLPESLAHERIDPAGKPSTVVRHYRTDGSLVEVWGTEGDGPSPTRPIDAEKLIPLATDPAVKF